MAAIPYIMTIKGRKEVKNGPCVIMTQTMYETTEIKDNRMDILYM